MRVGKEEKHKQVKSLAENSGLQIDNRMYYDPIYKSNMYGNFLHSLYTSEKYSITKIFFSIFLLVIPTIASDIIFTQQAFISHEKIQYGDKIGVFLYLYPLSFLIYFIAITIIIKSLHDKKRIKH